MNLLNRITVHLYDQRFSLLTLLCCSAFLGRRLYRNTRPLDRPSLDRAEARERKLTFGRFVSPTAKDNPIQPPERFTGYHTALDFEIFPDEKDQDVWVYASCNGPVVLRRWVEGYGGTLVQTCRIQDQDVTVLYGHLELTSIAPSLGDTLNQGDRIGRLGDDHSEETSNTRKHLHFAVHKGKDIALRGYVDQKQALDAYLDPEPLFGYTSNTPSSP